MNEKITFTYENSTDFVLKLIAVTGKSAWMEVAPNIRIVTIDGNEYYPGTELTVVDDPQIGSRVGWISKRGEVPARPPAHRERRPWWKFW